MASGGPGKYEKVKVVGTGTFGKAWLVRRRSDGELFCMKEIPTESWEAMVEAQNEAKIHSKLQHDHIIGFEECIKTDENIQIILEYAPGGDLGTMLYRRSMSKDYFSEDHVMVWLVQILEAIDYIHRRSAIHRDVKAANVFIMGDGSVKLGDFGCAKALDNNAGRIEQRTCRTPCGTPMYQSPEQCKGNQYTQKVDTWALGCVLYEMCALRPTYDANTLEELGNRIKMASYNKHYPHPYSQDLLDLIKDMFIIDSHLRPSTKDLLKRPFVQKYVGARLDESGALIPPPPEVADRLLEFNLTNGHLMRTQRDIHRPQAQQPASQARKHHSVPVIEPPPAMQSSLRGADSRSAPHAQSPQMHRAAATGGFPSQPHSQLQQQQQQYQGGESRSKNVSPLVPIPRSDSLDGGARGSRSDDSLAAAKTMRRNSMHPAGPVGPEAPLPAQVLDQARMRQQPSSQQLLQQQQQQIPLPPHQHAPPPQLYDQRNRAREYSAARRGEAFQYNYQASGPVPANPSEDDFARPNRHNFQYHGGGGGGGGGGMHKHQSREPAVPDSQSLTGRRALDKPAPHVGKGGGAIGGGGGGSGANGGGGIHAKLPPAPQYQFSKLTPLPSVGAQAPSKGYGAVNHAFNQSYRPHRVKVASLFDAPE